MKLRIRIWPVLISFVIAIATLFGGYHLYQSYALKSPLDEQIGQIEGVLSADSELKDREAIVTIELDRDASLRAVAEQIHIVAEPYINKRELTLNVNDSSSDLIDGWWSTMLFEIAEAMEKKQYSSIPTLLEDGASQVNGLTTFAEMDEHNVYIRLTTDEAQRFIILPRTPATYVGWSNE